MVIKTGQKKLYFLPSLREAIKVETKIYYANVTLLTVVRVTQMGLIHTKHCLNSLEQLYSE